LLYTSTKRRCCPKTHIILHAASGFARDSPMDWCETSKVDYVFVLARNSRLEDKIAPALEEACLSRHESGEPDRRFQDFRWADRDSWKRRRPIIGKAECMLKGKHPRFVVTSLSNRNGRPGLRMKICLALATRWKIA